MLAIFSKEFKSYFTSASGYIFMTVFLLISGIFFALSNILPATSNYNSVLSSITFIFLLLVPILTMRIISEESRLKTDQLLYTSPISITDVIIGKYLAAVSLFFISLFITGFYPLIMSMYGSIAGWEILGGYIGFALFGASLIAVGVFISSLTENQVVAAVSTFGALLFLWVLDWIQSGLPTSRVSGIVFAGILVVAISAIIYFSTRNLYLCAGTAAVGVIAMTVLYFAKKEVYEGLAVNFFKWISLLQRYDGFASGILSVSSIIYYITFSAAFIFLTIRMIDKRRWS